MEFATTTLELNPWVRTRIETAVLPCDVSVPRFVPAFYINAGAKIEFNVKPHGFTAVCQWRLNGLPIEGGTGAVLALSNLGATSAGTYSVAVVDDGASRVLDIATLTVVSDARLTDFSIHARKGGVDHALVVGFFLSGAGAKPVLLRRVGSTLRQSNAGTARERPELVLAGWGGTVIASHRGGEHCAEVVDTLAQVDPLSAPLTAADAALLATLETGGYSALVSGGDEASGGTFLQLYDADPGASSVSLSNASGRAYIGAGPAALTAGFKIAGTASATVLVRGVGPSLRSLFGVADALIDVRLILRDCDGQQIDSNQGWGGGAVLVSAFAPSGRVSVAAILVRLALLVTLPPGAYTAELSGIGGVTGVGLIEFYEVPAQ